jgi:uncharacterized protein (DUF1697 family)
MPSANPTKRAARRRSRGLPASAAASAGTRYVALLRGINVGGNNLIKMPALKACFEDNGFTDVATYIQSGNVLFQSPETNLERLTTDIEKALSAQFNYASRIVVVSHHQLKDAVQNAPKGFGTNPAEYRYDVIFLKAPLAAEEAMKSIATRDGVDEAFPGEGIIYFSRLIARATQSYLSRFAGLPIYKSVTVRNWNTTIKLLALMDAEASSRRFR